MKIAFPELASAAEKQLPPSKWKKMLVYCARLHEESMFPAVGPFLYPWVSVGKGYIHNPAFGHWDLVHACLDALWLDPAHVKRQIENYFNQETSDGMLPGVVFGPKAEGGGLGTGEFNPTLECSHPPVWTFLVDDYFARTGDKDFLFWAFRFGRRNLDWWAKERPAMEGGYYYFDITDRKWESGVDESVRFDDTDELPHACVDASSHIFALVSFMQKWAGQVGEYAPELDRERHSLAVFIREELWDEESGFFYDLWAVREGKKIKTFDGFWPMVCGAAAGEQVKRLAGHLTDEKEFFTYHPVPTIARDEPSYSFDMWRGPAWNSMTYWICRGFASCGFEKEAKRVAQRALDRSLERFRETGTVFEFYNSDSADVSALKRKGKDAGPCREYLGHNPLISLFMLVESGGRTS